MKHQAEYYTCDNCGDTVPTHRGVNIVTSKSESMSWSRLHVRIEHKHGMHNDATIEDAALCQDCAIDLLKDALKRVEGGERASKGVEDSKAKNWEIE